MFHFQQNPSAKPYSFPEELALLKKVASEGAQENFAIILERLRATPGNILGKISSQILDSDLLITFTDALSHLSENAKKTFSQIMYILIKFSSESVVNVEVDVDFCFELIKNKQADILQLILLKLSTDKVIFFLTLTQSYIGIGKNLWEALIQFSVDNPDPLYAACAQLKKYYPNKFDDSWNERLKIFFVGNSVVDIKSKCELILMTGHFKIPNREPSAPIFEENFEQNPPAFHIPPATTAALLSETQQQNTLLKAELLAVKEELNELKQRQKESAGKKPVQSNAVDQHEITHEMLMSLQMQMTTLTKTISALLIKNPTASTEIYRPSSPSKIGSSEQHVNLKRDSNSRH